MENKLTVRNLTISFRTMNGKVQAVRGINFDLKNGETLAIVGESGSGKSVTARAILGILAGNSIVEGGEIIYDGKNLLDVGEDDFNQIRGDKIAMIFQDPMSSLNPIVKIGTQLTEAMILKGKARQRDSRKSFNSFLALLEKSIIEATAEGDESKKAAIIEKCKNFDKFEYEHLRLEKAYNDAFHSANEISSDIDILVFEIDKNAAKDLHYRIHQVIKQSKESIQKYVVDEKKEQLLSLLEELGPATAAKDYDRKRAVEILIGINFILKEAITFDMPNFFAMGYYNTFSGKELPNLSVSELNAFLRKYLDENFMLDFIENAKSGISFSASRAYENKQKAVDSLNKALAVFSKEQLNKDECTEQIKILDVVVNDSIDRLETVKDGIAYTFTSGLKRRIKEYFKGINQNHKEQSRYDKQKAKYDALTKNGKQPDWKVVPAQIIDLELVKDNILRQVSRLSDHYNELLATKDLRNFDTETVAFIDFLKKCASGVVDKVTKSRARAKAIRLMDEVGIPEPRKRYYQYPFEFSGGMRQRIVIAIALAANPDILICDEPTTALDVTIQAQILELINKLKTERHLSVIFITHDLGVVANMADRIAVMYAGKIVEYGTADDVFYTPAHPYTWALLSSMPDLDTNEKLDAIPGTPPNMIFPPEGDAFAPRNKYAMKIDFIKQPPMFEISETHSAATWLLHPDAPNFEPPKIVTDRIKRMQELNASLSAENEKSSEKQGDTTDDK